MSRPLVSIVAFALAAAPASSPALQTMAFDLRPVADGQAELSLRTDRHSVSSRRVSFAMLAGLDRAALTAGRAVRFTWVLEPGTLSCDGMGSGGTASGTCRYAPDPTFAAFLGRYGTANPSADQRLALAMTGATRALVRAVAGAHYPPPTPAQLIELAAVGVNASYIAELTERGHRPPSLSALVQYAALGITPADLDGYTRAGYSRLTLDEVVQFRALGVTPAYVDGLARAGLRGVPASDLVQLKAVGVDPAFIAAFADAGYPGLRTETLVQLKAVGVTPAEAREARLENGQRPSTDRLIQARALLGGAAGE